MQVAQRHGLLLVAADPEPDGGLQGAQPSTGAATEATPGVCLVLGSEGRGLSPAVSQACKPIAIPMAGPMESLNVGVAGGILMFALSEGGAPRRLSARLASLKLTPSIQPAA